jgi:hypothetical protein
MYRRSGADYFHLQTLPRSVMVGLGRSRCSCRRRRGSAARRLRHRVMASSLSIARLSRLVISLLRLFLAHREAVPVGPEERVRVPLANDPTPAAAATAKRSSPRLELPQRGLVDLYGAPCDGVVGARPLASCALVSLFIIPIWSRPSAVMGTADRTPARQG